MRRAGPLFVATAATALAAAGLALPSSPPGASPAARAQSGLRGTVYIWPTTPVCTLYEPCEAPAPNVLLTFRRAGIVLGRARTQVDGTYRILLPAAIYRVTSDRPGPDRVNAPFPARVKVRIGHVDKLDFRIDTGIR